MSQLLLSLVSGVATGSIYGLIGLALVIIYQATDVVNFAMASMAMMALYLSSTLYAEGIGIYAAAAIAVLVGAVGGIAIREIVIRWVGSGQVFSALVITMGLALIVDDVTQKVWTGTPRSYPPLVSGQTSIAGVPVLYQQIITVVIAALAMGAVAYLFAAPRWARRCGPWPSRAPPRSSSVSSHNASPGSRGASASAWR